MSPALAALEGAVGASLALLVGLLVAILLERDGAPARSASGLGLVAGLLVGLALSSVIFGCAATRTTRYRLEGAAAAAALPAEHAERACYTAEASHAALEVERREAVTVLRRVDLEGDHHRHEGVSVTLADLVSGAVGAALAAWPW